MSRLHYLKVHGEFPPDKKSRGLLDIFRNKIHGFIKSMQKMKAGQDITNHGGWRLKKLG